MGFRAWSQAEWERERVRVAAGTSLEMAAQSEALRAMSEKSGWIFYSRQSKLDETERDETFKNIDTVRLHVTFQHKMQGFGNNMITCISSAVQHPRRGSPLHTSAATF
jgi:hypothetical protein